MFYLFIIILYLLIKNPFIMKLAANSLATILYLLAAHKVLI
jgi:hypothetical protein